MCPNRPHGPTAATAHPSPSRRFWPWWSCGAERGPDLDAGDDWRDLVLITGCIDADEAFSYIEGRLLALIFAMLGVGAALQSSGAVAMIADALSPYLMTLPSFFIVLAVYLLASFLTEMVSNNAVAVVMTPIAIGLAASLGVDPRPLVVAVMIAASASFATPIGYQTNTLVYGPGGYKFTDFLRIGVPLNLSLAPIVSFVIPMIWPL